jgi:hypothetical protein
MIRLHSHSHNGSRTVAPGRNLEFEEEINGKGSYAEATYESG